MEKNYFKWKKLYIYNAALLGRLKTWKDLKGALIVSVCLSVCSSV